jgi:cytochrome d ubiquinol oxidase subunit I
VIREDGVFEPTDWMRIVFSPVAWVRFPHMLLAAYLTGAFCIASTGAWHLLRGRFKVESATMLRMSLGLAAVLVPIQIFFGHLTGDYVHDKQPAKFAAIEGRWHDEQPAREVLIAWPDEKTEQNSLEIAIPYLGSVIASMSLTSKEVGLTSFPEDVRPPMLIPFFAFRVMVGCGVAMLTLAWAGSFYAWFGRIEEKRWLLWPVFASFPLGFIATLTGWFTAEVGRQPWTVYGQLRTADAVTPSLTAQEVSVTLVLFGLVYTALFLFGSAYIYILLQRGPIAGRPKNVILGNPKRPLSGAAVEGMTAEERLA